MIKRVLAVILFSLISLGMFSQTYNMPTQGYIEIHSDSVTLYDDGGSTGNYSTRVKSVVTIYPITTGGFVYLSGLYSLENQYKSRLEFYSGDTNSTTQITTAKYNSGCLNIRSIGPITIRFFVDTETPNSGFEFNIRVCNDRPINDNVFNVTDSTAEFSWNSQNSSTNWIFAYKKGANGSVTEISTDTNYIKLENLERGTRYYYSIYTECDTVSNECGRFIFPFNQFTTTNSIPIEPPPPPLITNMVQTIYCDAIELSWTSIDTNIVWLSTMYNYAKERTDSIISNSTNIRFDSLLSATSHTIKICPIDTSIENYNCYTYRYLRTKCCCPIAENLHAIEIQSNFITIGWDFEEDTSIDLYSWIVAHKLNDGLSSTYVFDTVYTNQITIDSLSSVSTYEIKVYSSCDDLNNRCSETIYITTGVSGVDNCLNFTNLSHYSVTAHAGYYDNPYQSLGLIDYGYQSPESRHTVHYDTTEYDLRTANLLKTIPPEEEASVRLGNWIPGRGAESLTYSYLVDTNDFDMFLLKYAIVLEDPEHEENQQPRFTLEIMDSNYVLLDQDCGYTNFYASEDLGWNAVQGSSVIWKDWTSIGINLSPYHNQKINFRFTTYDCDEGGHFGYAYYNIKCANKYSNKEFCGDIDSLLFEAPYGFDYLWYNASNIDDTISTNQNITVPINQKTYYCECSYKENENCNFTLTFVAEKTFPNPKYDYREDTCGYLVYFENKSIVSLDDSLETKVRECLDVEWIFHDGTKSFDQKPTFVYDSSGVYPVLLIARINDGECVDTLFSSIVINLSEIKKVEFFGDTLICNGSYTEIGVNDFDNYQWSTGDTTNVIHIAPSERTMYHVQVNDAGCIRKDSIIVYVDPYHYIDTIYGAICSGTYYNQFGFFENTKGFYTEVYKAYNGCDSIRNLVLDVAKSISNYSLIEDKSMIIEDLPIQIDVSCNYCYNYYWNNGSKDSILNVMRYGNYYVSIDHICGRIYDSVSIKSPEVNIFVPNAFTPDESNNNTFYPSFINNNSISLESFEIYNKWGTKVHNSITIPWDGTYKNNIVPNGVYLWRLLYRTKYTGNKLFEMKGKVTLIR